MAFRSISSRSSSIAFIASSTAAAAPASDCRSRDGSRARTAATSRCEAAATKVRSSSRRCLHRELAGFDQLPHARHELIGHRAVDQSMIERERYDAHRTDGDGVAVFRFDNDRTLLHAADAENRQLRLIDDWGPKQSAVDA